jgi:hypothetical protein
MRVTRRQLKRIIKEEKLKLEALEQPHYAHNDIVGEVLEVMEVWSELSKDQWYMVIDDAMKRL